MVVYKDTYSLIESNLERIWLVSGINLTWQLIDNPINQICNAWWFSSINYFKLQFLRIISQTPQISITLKTSLTFIIWMYLRHRIYHKLLRRLIIFGTYSSFLFAPNRSTVAIQQNSLLIKSFFYQT